MWGDERAQQALRQAALSASRTSGGAARASLSSSWMIAPVRQPTRFGLLRSLKTWSP